MEKICKVCGSEMEIDNAGVSTHIVEGGGIDFEANRDHTAIALIKEEM